MGKHAFFFRFLFVFVFYNRAGNGSVMNSTLIKVEVKYKRMQHSNSALKKVKYIF